MGSAKVDTPLPDSTISPRATSLLGTLVNSKWRVERVLGEGGMATVYFAMHEHTNRRAAIKVLHPEFCHTVEARERFSREARAANSVNHRGAVPVLDDGELDDGTPYLVMDYLEGESVLGRLQACDMSIPVDEVLSITAYLLEVLEAAHQAGVLHRDIKPDNIHLTTEGEVKLLDFGISKMSNEPQDHKTQVGVTMGTPAYMAPEQARGRWDEIGPRTEIFAVGATMFTMLSGKQIHTADTNNELLLKVMTVAAPDVREAAPHVPAGVAEIINRALAFDQKDRFASAQEMHAAVTMLIGDHVRQSQHSFRDSQLPPLLAVSEVTTSRTTYRPVTFSLFESPTIAKGLQSARRKWKYGVAMFAAALLSYLVVASTYSDEESTLSPVSAIQPPAADELHPEMGAPAAGDQGSDVIKLDDLPEDEPREKSKSSSKSTPKSAAPISGKNPLVQPAPSWNANHAVGTPHPEEETPAEPEAPAPRPIKDDDPLARRR